MKRKQQTGPVQAVLRGALIGLAAVALLAAALGYLILAGVIIGSVFSALVSIMKYLSNDSALREIVFWLMGSMSKVDAESLRWSIPAFIIGIGALYALRWRINLLSLGEEEARALGVNTKAERAAVIFICTILSCFAVCIAGTIGWVGLVIPHMGRIFVGSDYRKLIPVSISLGGIYLIIIDNAARALTANEIPLGILTALIGAPFFAFLLMKKRAGWQG